MKKTIGQDFMLQTRFEKLQPTAQMQGASEPALEMPYDNTLPVIELPSPETFPEININLLEFIELRTSVRNYTRQSVTLPELSYLLWCTQGVKAMISGTATFRTVPSAGARHAFETYLLLNNVEDVQPGLYRFLAVEHMLQQVNPDAAMADKIAAACFDKQCIRQSAVTFLWTAVTERMTWKYGDRGYRYLHLDAGHVCQNLYLTGESIGCGTCAIGAFDDEQLNSALGIDGSSQFVIYLATVGKK